MFRQNIFKKYAEIFSEETINERYRRFKDFFDRESVQENIAASKEEQFQEGFLRALFVDVLGYSLFPSPNYNLVAEQKNEDDAKKADAAILVDGETVGVVELKDMRTVYLDKAETQAFSYKDRHKKARYVVLSNFRKLRFYVDSAVEFLEFDLFNLAPDKFRVLYVCLSWDSMRQGIPGKILDESLVSEVNITERFYRDYSACKQDLYRNIVARNSKRFGKLTLFQKTQKLLDRLLFVFFAEDCGLLTPNSSQRVIDDWKTTDAWIETPFYDFLKRYFQAIDVGSERLGVFAYDGGLFREDDVLDQIQIDDDVLTAHIQRLNAYDFNSEVDVDVLGRIFEHSLSEIAETSRQIIAEETNAPDALEARENARKNKRKNDGVFYTPRYVVDFIVDSTLGKLCREKKAELGFDDETFDVETTSAVKGLTRKEKKEPGRRKKEERARLENLLTTYGEWLKGLTICDPACGSGAFLNAAFQFLLNERRYVDELTRRVQYGSAPSLVFQDVENYILENNLFGVDVNEESVEITRLSLWLRTCRQGHRLNDLSANIKRGDSLIDDPKLGGADAFDWKKEFPQVFEKGGFDVVIGNPPYVQLQKSRERSERLAACGYETYDKSGDLYCLFVERGYALLKKGGVQSYIMSNSWLKATYGESLRRFLADKRIAQLLNFGDVQFFADAVVRCCILTLEKSARGGSTQLLSVDSRTYGDFKSATNRRFASQVSFGAQPWTIKPREHERILQKAESNRRLKELPVSIFRGVLTGFNDAFVIDDETRRRLVAKDRKSAELIKPLLRGRDLWRYGARNRDDLYLIATFPSLNVDVEEYPAIKEHLLSFGKERLNQTGEPGARKKTSNQWFETQDSIDYYREFTKPKVVYPNMTAFFPFAYEEGEVYYNQKAFILTAKDESVSLKYLTALFNSKASRLWLWYNCPELVGGTRELSKIYFENIPVPKVGEKRAEIEKLVDRRIDAYRRFCNASRRLSAALRVDFPTFKGIENVESFHTFDFSAFKRELKKQKIDLPLKKQAEWKEFFESRRSEAFDASTLRERLDSELEDAVAELFGFDAEEREILRALNVG